MGYGTASAALAARRRGGDEPKSRRIRPAHMRTSEDVEALE